MMGMVGIHPSNEAMTRLYPISLGIITGNIMMVIAIVNARLWYGVTVYPLMTNPDSVIIPPPVRIRLKRLERTTTMVEDHGFLLNSLDKECPKASQTTSCIFKDNGGLQDGLRHTFPCHFKDFVELKLTLLLLLLCSNFLLCFFQFSC